jgi:hypothetical protein
MEHDFETNSSHFCTSRTSLWCPVCGAKEGQGCTYVKGLRFSAHNANVIGPVPREQDEPVSFPARRMQDYRPKRTPNRWVN